MRTLFIEHIQAAFEHVLTVLKKEISVDESFSLALSSESSNFIRLNHAKIRQSTTVDQGSINLTFQKNKRSTKVVFPLTVNQQENEAYLRAALAKARNMIDFIPEDPYFVDISGDEKSHEVHAGKYDNIDQITEQVLDETASLDFAGIIVGGPCIRASANSLGMFHWFSSDFFYVDFSIYTPNQKAVKGMYSEKEWSLDKFRNKMEFCQSQLDLLKGPIKTINRGKYRTYFEPDAVSNFVGMLSWNGVSVAALKQGHCALTDLYNKSAALSSKINLAEDFSMGVSPRFNSMGEVAPQKLHIIKDGGLENLLVSRRSAKEYNLTSNAAEMSEGLRSASLATGILKREDVLKKLDTGIYISNLHYLNWSDLLKGRMTGMTRYACFWVENGQLQSPIQDMRFDDSLYNFWGGALEELTDFSEVIPDTSTYEERSLGGLKVPGMLVSEFNYSI